MKSISPLQSLIHSKTEHYQSGKELQNQQNAAYLSTISIIGHLCIIGLKYEGENMILWELNPDNMRHSLA